MTKPSEKCPPEQNTGRVVTRYGAELLVQTPERQTIRCTARRKFEHVACGDYVCWQANEQGNASVIKLQKRKNTLSRPDYRGKAKAIAANIDQLFIVTAWLPKPSWNLVDRYLLAAEKLGLESVIVINKADIAEKHRTANDQLAIQEYENIGYKVLHTQAIAGESIIQGIDAIQDQLTGKTSIFVGQSGVGKSSLIGQILPELDIRTGEISDNGEGRHTTTTADLYTIKQDTYVIDSPGVRDFILADLQEEDIINGYREFKPHSPYCRFNNCKHNKEPACAIKQAVAENQLPAKRYERYLQQLNDFNT